VRHDYFRRILCNWLAERITAQDFPKSSETCRQLLYDMCYGNAKQMTVDIGENDEIQ
ncbi:MAG: glucuronate isomerase, partial [Lachnospiraceae bacterium]|nr:glucuronate isomerase [Lachnospiraceae bacterium]